MYESMRHGMNLNLKSWGALINTFYSLEPLYVDHLRTISGRPVWSVGPLLPPAVFEGGGWRGIGILVLFLLVY